MWENSKNRLDYDLILIFIKQGKKDDTKYLKDEIYFFSNYDNVSKSNVNEIWWRYVYRFNTQP